MADKVVCSLKEVAMDISKHVDLSNAIFAEGITATEEQVMNILRRMDRSIERRRTMEDCHHDWYCGCGHWNGPNLAACALCGRTPGESLPR